MLPSSKPSDVKQDSKEQFKITGYQFSAEIENSFKSLIQMDADRYVKIFLKIAPNLTNILWKTK